MINTTDTPYWRALLSLAAAILCRLISSFDRVSVDADTGAEVSVAAVTPAGFAVVSSKNPAGAEVGVGVTGPAASAATLTCAPVSLILSVMPSVPLLIPFARSCCSARRLAWSVA
jgi:hypothetical protein